MSSNNPKSDCSSTHCIAQPQVTWCSYRPVHYLATGNWFATRVCTAQPQVSGLTFFIGSVARYTTPDILVLLKFCKSVHRDIMFGSRKTGCDAFNLLLRRTMFDDLHSIVFDDFWRLLQTACDDFQIFVMVKIAWLFLWVLLYCCTNLEFSWHFQDEEAATKPKTATPSKPRTTTTRKRKTTKRRKTTKKRKTKRKTTKRKTTAKKTGKTTKTATGGKRRKKRRKKRKTRKVDA